jgi:tRNA dimethylallyltransferase
LDNSKKQKLVCVCGTTASGKSDLSITLAKAFNTSIVCLDSAQAFKHADIGSAKVPKDERGGVEHRLIDFVEADQRLEAGSFIKKAGIEIQGLIDNGMTPLLCVGTSLYFRLLLEGIAETGSADQEIRAKLEESNTSDLYRKLMDLDSTRANNLHPNDRVRIIRALEIFGSSGKTPSQLYAQQQRDLNYDALLIILIWDREVLSKRIEARTKQMFMAGLIEENKFILERYGANSQIFEGIGYSEIIDFLNDKTSEHEALNLVSTHTKQLAKRQLTFWRRFPAKLGFELSPQQNFAEQLQLQKAKNTQLQVNCSKMNLAEIKLEIEKFKAEGGLKALYVDAAYLLESTETIAD